MMSSTMMTSWIRMKKALPVRSKMVDQAIPSEQWVMTSHLIFRQEWEGWEEALLLEEV